MIKVYIAYMIILVDWEEKDMSKSVKNKKNDKRKIRKVSILVKLMTPTSIMVLLVAIFMGVSAYLQMNASLLATGVESAEMAATMALSAVTGNEVKEFPQTGDKTVTYNNTLTALRNVQEMCEIKYLYILYCENEKMYYSVDTDSASDRAVLGDEYENATYEELKTVYEGKTYAQDYIDEENLITVYKPIRDGSGKVVAILGSDYDASGVKESLNGAIIKIALNAIIGSIISQIIIGIIVTRMVKSLRDVDNKIFDLVNSDGDLTRKLDVKSGDELELIANDVNSLLEHIRQIMVNIAENSEKVKGSSESVAKHLADTEVKITDVSATMEQMSAAMEETSASLTGVNEAVELIHGAILTISDNATDGSTSSNEIMEKAATIHSEAVVNREDALVKAKKMKATVNEKIEESKAVEEINVLTDEILSITSQTNLLALNANIEAARAGEAGRGFAVVASEIGKLASDSAEAANKIREVSEVVINAVSKLAEESENMVNFMDEVAMAGYEKLLETSESYKNDVEHTGAMMQEFAAASERLKRNIDDIKEAVSAVNIAVEESTNGIGNVTIISSEITEAVSEIEKQAHGNMEVATELNGQVNKFKLS